MDTDNAAGLPPGWSWCTRSDAIVTKPLEDFRHLDVRYDYDGDRGKYAVFLVDCDGPRDIRRVSEHDTLDNAMKSADLL